MRELGLVVAQQGGLGDHLFPRVVVGELVVAVVVGPVGVDRGEDGALGLAADEGGGG